MMEDYIDDYMYCAVSDDLYASGGCGACYRLSWDGSSGTDAGTPGSAEIQVVDTGAGGSVHFDCFEDAHEAITGTATGIFPIHYELIDCKERDMYAIVLEYNAYYTKVLFAGGYTGVQSATLILDGTSHTLTRGWNSATFTAGLYGVSLSGGSGLVRFEVTYVDGKTTELNDCFGGNWPVLAGDYCTGPSRSN